VDISVTGLASAAEYVRLGEMLNGEFDKHADQMVGKAKEDFDGSSMVLREDIAAADKKAKGKFFLVTLIPGSYPIGHTDKYGQPHPKALPSGSNDVSDRFYIEKNGKTSASGSRIAAIVSGTGIGRKYKSCAAALERVVKTADPENKSKLQPLTTEERAAVISHLVTIDQHLGDLKWDNMNSVQSTLERLNARFTTLCTRFAQGWALERQIRIVKDLDLQGGTFAWGWRSNVAAIRHASRAPLYLTYSYREEGAETDTASPLYKKLSVGTFCRFNVSKAVKEHKAGTDFLVDLRNTIKRNTEDQRRKQVNVYAPGVTDVEAMLGSVREFLKNPINKQAFWDWMQGDDGEANRYLVVSASQAIEREALMVKSQVDKDLAKKRQAQAAKLAAEDEAMAKEGKSRAA